MNLTSVARRVSAFLCWFVAGTACAPHRSVVSGSGKSGAVSADPAQVSRCKQAAARRARVPVLLREGRLHRTLLVIDDANRLCPETSKQTWAEEVSTLAEIGRTEATRSLAKQILANEPTSEQRAAVAQATALVEKRAVPTKNAKRALALVNDAKTAAAKNDYKRASALYIAAWEQWHPGNGPWLMEAGHNTKLAGDNAGAQRLFDRALEELEQRYGAEVRAEPSDYRSDDNDSIVLSPKGDKIATLRRGFVRVSRLSDGKLLRVFQKHHHTIAAMAFYPDGATIALAHWDGDVRLRRLSDGAVIRAFKGYATGAINHGIAISPNGRLLAFSSSEGLKLWNIADGSLHRMIPYENAQRVWSMTFTPDSKGLAAAACHGPPMLWNVDNGEPYVTFKEFENKLGRGEALGCALAVSPDGQSVAVGGLTGKVRIVRVSDGTILRSLSVHDGTVQALAFTPGGQLATGVEGKVQLWNTSDGSLLRSFEGPIGSVHSLASTPDGRHLLALEGFYGGGWTFVWQTERKDLLFRWGAWSSLSGSGRHLSDLEGPWFTCRIGASSFPSELCFERVNAPDLWATLMAGSLPAVDPVAPLCEGEAMNGMDPGSSTHEGMRRVPGGPFPYDNDGDEELREIAPFEMDETEVTVAAYAVCVKAGACPEPEHTEKTCNWGKKDKQDYPINCVGRKSAAAYCSWAGKRLPTELEWKYAAWGTDRRLYPWGNEDPRPGQICIEGEKPKPLGGCRVRSHPCDRSPFGMFDMGANVMEWAMPEDSNLAVLVGSAWSFGQEIWLRSSHSPPVFPGWEGAPDFVGFRCAR